MWVENILSEINKYSQRRLVVLFVFDFIVTVFQYLFGEGISSHGKTMDEKELQEYFNNRK